MSRIIAVCPKEYPGVNSVFRHGASLGYWSHVTLGEEISEHDILILGAWHPDYMALLNLKSKKGIYITSTLGQMDFSQDMVELKQLEAMQRLLKEKQIDFVLSGWPDVADLFLGTGYFCPYPFDESLLNRRRIKIQNSVGIFLPYSPRKNMTNQLTAAIKSGAKIFTNLPVSSSDIKQVGWLDNESYYTQISEMKLTLHCTFTESFSYGAAESLFLGTLPIVSTQIAENLFLGPELTCHQCDSVKNILEKILYILNLDPLNYQILLNKQLARARVKLQQNRYLTKKLLDELSKL